MLFANYTEACRLLKTSTQKASVIIVPKYSISLYKTLTSHVVWHERLFMLQLSDMVLKLQYLLSKLKNAKM